MQEKMTVYGRYKGSPSIRLSELANGEVRDKQHGGVGKEVTKKVGNAGRFFGRLVPRGNPGGFPSLKKSRGLASGNTQTWVSRASGC